MTVGQIECYDWDSDGSSDYIGECLTSVAALLGGARQFEVRVSV